MKKNNRKGFTIVELVIVIAVIAILAGVLIPTFSGIVNKAKLNAALQEAKTIMTNYTASIDYTKEQPKELYYIQVLKDDNGTKNNDTDDKFYFFKVEKGVIPSVAEENKEKRADFTITEDTYFVVADTNNDGWPEVEKVSAP